MAEAVAILSQFKWLAPVATDLLKKGYSYLDLDVDVDEKLHDLQNIPQIEMVIEAMKNSPHEDKLRGWLKSLEEAVYEAEDELDLQDYYLLEQKVKIRAGEITVRLESLPPIKYFTENFNIKLKESLAKLEKTAVKAKEFLHFLSKRSSNVRTTNESRESDTTSLLPHGVVVFGRHEERDNIVDFLHETTAGLESESSYSVVAIVGVGGAGKTTLAKYVCKHEREADPKYFDVIMWVPVSQIFDVENLTKEMVESASGKECPNLTNLDSLQQKLADSIRFRKFLLVLDDVWIEKENATTKLKILLAPLSAGKRGSKILMTTREMGVANALHARNIVPLKELKKDDFFAMFRHYAFGDIKNDDDELCEELEDIMRQNAPKLHGSPLAARVVGSQLSKRRDVDFWKRTLSGGDLLKDTMESLLWSYQNLDAPLQRCFSYCSLFLKGDNIIKREELIHMWIAEGFIKHSDRIEDVGQKYFDDLLSSSFFQPTERDGCYTMHDLLHDLAETVSKDRCLRVEGNLTKTIPQEIRHLSLNIDIITSDLVEKICNLKNLRTLIIFMRTDNGIDDNLLRSIFFKLKKLRVVHLNIFRLQNLPESIGGLKHLRYLNLCQSEAILPESIYTLYHLKFLYVWELRLVSKELANWINLQHLYFFKMILNVAGINGWEQLGNQRKFHGRIIEIDGLENVKEKREVNMDITDIETLRREINMDIMDIETLHLEWSTTDNNSRSLDMDVLKCLTMLEELTIHSCWFLTSLGGLQALGSLRELVISFCPNLSAEGGNTSVLPSSLRQLEIEACHWQHLDDSQPDLTSSINSNSSDNIPFLASLKLGHLKLLTELSISNCPNIGSLLGLQELNELTSLTLIGCPKLIHAETKLGSLRKEFKIDDPLLLYMLLAENVIASLPKLQIKNFRKISFTFEEEQVFQHLTSLTSLVFNNCSIKFLPNNLKTLSSLKKLRIIGCPNIKSLPDLPSTLDDISLISCNPVLKR